MSREPWVFKEDPLTADIPVVVLTSKSLSRADQLLAALTAAGLQREPAYG